MIQITFLDKKQKKFDEGITALEIAKSISTNFAKTCIAVELNNKILDLSTKITNDAHIRFITLNDYEALEIMRHTAAHVMAQAILRLYPSARLAIGPTIKDGFYYDIEMEPLSKENFPQIEAEMKKIIKSKIPIVRKEISKIDALEFYKSEPYKTEMISELKDGTISFYEQDNFIDLCRGPHAPHTGFVKSIKLMRVSGAYWRANQANPQLQRIYGTAFFNSKDLNSYVNFLEKAEKRNHRKIATDMNLISFHNEAPGTPLFHPKGVTIWNCLLEYWRKEHQKAGYLEIKTPTIMSRSLWEKSGHWENYKSNMYTTEIDKQDFAIKPMNCPGSMLFYNSRAHSYKEFPIRIAEIGLVHRHELSGVLNGLFRVRAFHQDDAHIFMTKDQVANEVLKLLKFEKKIYKTFGLSFKLELSTQPQKFIGSKEQWNSTTNDLKSALEAYGQKFRINIGDGAFYGPKIDLHIKDALNRTWQCGTIQLDMSLPERFDLSYVDKNNEKHSPIVLHRTIFGSIERFFGILIEHFAGKFPLWLAPIQAVILPINNALITPSKDLAEKMQNVGIRVKVNIKSERLNKKIKTAQLSKIPLILVFGTKENETETISVRTLNGTVINNISYTKFFSTVIEHISQKKISLDVFEH